MVAPATAHHSHAIDRDASRRRAGAGDGKDEKVGATSALLLQYGVKYDALHLTAMGLGMRVPGLTGCECRSLCARVAGRCLDSCPMAFISSPSSRMLSTSIMVGASAAAMAPQQASADILDIVTGRAKRDDVLARLKVVSGSMGRGQGQGQGQGRGRGRG